MPTPTQVPALVSLPGDDNPHVNVNTEWWYYSGHIESGPDSEYHFHYVVFEVRLPGLPVVNIAHLSVTDPKEGAYIIGQRVALGTPESKEDRGFSFDVGGWSMSGFDGHDRLSASVDGYILDLELLSAKPPALHDRTGLVDFGQAGKSYYYSRTRMSVNGKISVADREAPVMGNAWFDHQWGNFEVRAVAWDWFALQLEEGSEVMLTVFRDDEGRDLRRYGTFIATDGAIIHLSPDEFQVSSTGSWTSPASGATYPVDWRIQIPSQAVDVQLVPVLKMAEFDATGTTFNYYWEGAVKVSGSHRGRGFVEMTGYAPIRVEGR